MSNEFKKSIKKKKEKDNNWFIPKLNLSSIIQIASRIFFIFRIFL